MTDEPESSETDTLELPASDRRGRFAALGLIALGVGVLSWLVPLVGAGVAVLAIGCGSVSILTRQDYRIDWTAVVGICLGGAQLLFELVLFAMDLGGL